MRIVQAGKLAQMRDLISRSVVVDVFDDAIPDAIQDLLNRFILLQDVLRSNWASDDEGLVGIEARHGFVLLGIPQ